MRTYYSGPDALVTQTHLTIRPPRGPTYALHDIDAGQLEIIETDNSFVVLYPVDGMVLSLLFMSPVAFWGWGWPGVVISVLVAAVIGAAGRVWLARRPVDYTLEGLYRGARTSFLTTGSEARAFQIRYAMREAMERPPWA